MNYQFLQRYQDPNPHPEKDDMAALIPLDASCTSSTVIGCVANRDGDAIRLNLDSNQFNILKKPKITVKLKIILVVRQF